MVIRNGCDTHIKEIVTSYSFSHYILITDGLSVALDGSNVVLSNTNCTQLDFATNEIHTSNWSFMLHTYTYIHIDLLPLATVHVIVFKTVTMSILSEF